MGDPETQALMPRLQTDLVKLIAAAKTQELKNQTCALSSETAVHVVAVSQGYPQAQMLLGKTVSYPALSEFKTELLFCRCQRKRKALSEFRGRVLGITALAANKNEARSKAYQDLRKISFEGMYFREDIGQ